MGSQLEKISYFNTGRFPYAEINVNGNTMVTGTNGVGKTTTMQSILFFYGANKSSQLGISRRKGHDTWIRYSYPHINSYVVYQYRGHSGKVAVITYAYSNKIAYRFVAIDNDFDIKAMVMDGNMIREPKVLLRTLTLAGYAPSEQIDRPEQYKKVLYGDIDKRKDKALEAFIGYSFMKAKGEYKLISEVISGIFLSPTVDAGAIERAIATGVEAVTLDVTHIASQMALAREKYSAILVYENNQKLINEISSSVKQHQTLEQQALTKLRQAKANYVHYKTILPQQRPLLEKLHEENNTFIEQSIKTEASLRGQRDTKFAEKSLIENELLKAQSLREEWADKRMPEKEIEVDKIDEYEAKLSAQEEAHFELLGDQKDVAEIYDKQIVSVKKLERERIQALSSDVEKKRDTLEEQIIEAEDERDNEIKTKTKQIKAQLKEQEKVVKDARSAAKSSSEIYYQVLHVNPYTQESTRLKTELDALSVQSEKDEVHLKHLKQSLESNTFLIEQYGESKVHIQEEAIKRFEAERREYNTRIEEHEAMLNISEEALLSFIRTELPAKEGLFASMLKDEVLLNTTLSPKVDSDGYSVYGISVDTSELQQSEYGQEAIQQKIHQEKNAIHLLNQKIEKETEEKIAPIQSKMKELSRNGHSFREKIDGLEHVLFLAKGGMIKLEERYIKALEEEKSKWEKSKAEAHFQEKADADAENEAYKQQQVLNETQSNISDTVRLIYDQRIGVLKESKKTERKRGEREKLRIETETSTQVEEIEKQKSLALEQGGVSKEQLEKLSKQIKELHKRLSEAKGYTKDVAIWQNDKLSMNKISLFEQELVETTERFKQSEQQLRSKLIEIGAEKKRRDDELKKQELLVDKAENEIKEHDAFVDRDIFIRLSMMLKQSEETVAPDTDLIMIRLKSDISITYNDLMKKEEAVQKMMQKFVSKLGSRESIYFTYDDTSLDTIIRSAKDLRAYMNDGRLQEQKELVAREIKYVLMNTAERHRQLSDATIHVEKLVKAIDKVLKSAITNVQVLQDIGIRYSKSEHKVLADLTTLSEIDIPIGDARSLFAGSGGDKDTYEKILKIFTDIDDTIINEGVKELSISDAFDVEFKVVENGNDTGWVRNRGGIGSTGTAIIIKTLTYIALLDTILAKTRKDNDVSVHILLDEIGTLDTRNTREIIKFANNNGINVFNAAPDVKAPDMYNAIYNYRLHKTKSKIIKVAVRR